MRVIALTLIALIIINPVFAAKTALKGKKEVIHHEQTLDFSEVKELDISVVSARLVLREASDAKLILTGESSIPATDLISVKKENNKIEIKTVEKNKDLFDSPFSKLMLTVVLPKKIYDKFRVEAVSGDIQGASVEAKEIYAKTVSGEIDFHSLKAAEKIEIKTVSGDVQIEQIEGRLKASSVSGDVDIKTKNLLAKLDVKTTSGDVELELPTKSDFSVKAETVSGAVETGFDIKSVEEFGDTLYQGKNGVGTHELTFNTVSGDISIKKN